MRTPRWQPKGAYSAIIGRFPYTASVFLSGQLGLFSWTAQAYPYANASWLFCRALEQVWSASWAPVLGALSVWAAAWVVAVARRQARVPVRPLGRPSPSCLWLRAWLRLSPRSGQQWRPRRPQQRLWRRVHGVEQEAVAAVAARTASEISGSRYASAACRPATA